MDDTTAPGNGGERRTSVVLGGLLIVVGVALLLANQLRIDWAATGWPIFVIAPGLVLFALAFAVGGPGGAGFAVAGAIVTTTGLLLAAQNATGLWATWAYAWALVAPGSVGAGLLLYGSLTGQRSMAADGGRVLLVGLGLFLGFAFFFESVIGLSGNRLAWLDSLLPAGLVVLGIAIVVLSLAGGRRRAG
jgi:hypothetical protein